jgi:hypothetical protein
MIESAPARAAARTNQGRLVTASAFRFLERAMLALFGLIAFFALASCGSGAVGGNPAANDPNRITILPGDGTIVYAGQPVTFNVAGGTNQYIITSSNPSVIAIPDNPRATFKVVPSAVGADTQVTISARDTGTTPVATATITVRANTIVNEIQVTPSSTQSPDCPAGTLCSGGDALVTATLTQAGVPLVGRTVRFDAVSGDFRFITSPSGSPETLATTAFATTDSNGRASVRVRALADAPNQTAIVQVTDVASGSSRQVAFTIAQSTGTSPGFIAVPSGYTFSGPRADQCASSNTRATFFIYGGSPPYTVASASPAIQVTRDTVSFSGGSFDVVPQGQCVDDIPITIRDSAGHTTTVTVSNVRGTEPVPAFVVAPSTVSLSSCSSFATVQAIGGSGNYTASTGNPNVFVGRFSTDPGAFSIARNPNTGPTTSPVTVAFSDGQTLQTVTVTLTGQALGACPPPAFSATPTSVTLTSCTVPAQVNLTGGSGVYTATTNRGALKPTITGGTLSIGRNPGPAGSGTVTASDGSATQPITVTDNAGPC